MSARKDKHEILRALWEGSRSVGSVPKFALGDKRARDYLLGNEPFEGQDRIADYLRSAGFCVGAVPGSGVDPITGERFSKDIMCDGAFTWCRGLAHFVDRYSIRLDPEFERAVLADPSRAFKFRLMLKEYRFETWEIR